MMDNRSQFEEKSVEFSYLEEDFVETQIFLTHALYGNESMKAAILGYGVAAFGVLLLILYLRNFTENMYFIFLPLLCIYMGFNLTRTRQRVAGAARTYLKNAKAKKFLDFNKNLEYRFSKNCIFLKFGDNRSEIPWAAVKLIRQEKNYIFVLLGMLSTIAIPIRAFKGTEEFEKFYRYIVDAKSINQIMEPS
jgi:hypothetical protein